MLYYLLSLKLFLLITLTLLLTSKCYQNDSNPGPSTYLQVITTTPTSNLRDHVLVNIIFIITVVIIILS